MTSLFRPWTEEKTVTNSPEEMTNLLLSNSDSESKTETTAREDKYKSVKEHMKKRSEKYLLKKLKARNEKPEVATFSDKQNLDFGMNFPFYCPPPPPSSSSSSLPPETFLPSLDCFLPQNNIPGVVGGVFTTEFVDSAFSQGFSSSVFEEYAKFLTEQQRIVTERNRKQRPKKFRCPHCHVGFSNNGQLKGHIRIHTGERPFKCDAESCGKSFTRNEELTRHRRIHSGLRPFPCSECGKRFGRKDHLKKHVKTHFQQRYQLVPILPSHCPYFYGL